MPPKVVGILGGMGPEATVDFMAKIIKNTPAQIDQEHIRMLVDNNPQVPDRSKAILEGGPSSGPTLAEMALKLENWGAQILAMPCNTAHYFAPEIEGAVKIPFLNMIEETASVLVKENIKSAALLATMGTIKTGLYEKILTKYNIEMILPSEDVQAKVMEIIHAVKSGNYHEIDLYKSQVEDHIIEKGAKAAILGCTELPIAFKSEKGSVLSLYDPTDILAKGVVREALR